VNNPTWDNRRVAVFDRQSKQITVILMAGCVLFDVIALGLAQRWGR
jgi:hypothetical protein